MGTPLTLKECLTPAIPVGLSKYQPNIEYVILDVGRVAWDEKL